MKRPQSDTFLAEPASKRAKTAFSNRSADDGQDAAINVAYIACPGNAHLHSFIQAVRNAIEAGADIINISFSRTKSQVASYIEAGVLPAIKSVFDAEWISSVAHLTAGSVMSFFSNSRADLLSGAILDPEEGWPAILLTFQCSSRTYLHYHNFFANASKKDQRTVAQSLCQYRGEHKGRDYPHWRRFR